MTISATTQGLRMGVATSSSRPTVPFDGQVISETDTDSLKVYNGTSWVGVGGLVLVKAETAFTGQSSFNVANIFSSSYTNYLIHFNFTAATSNGGIGCRLSVGGTAAATNYNYMRVIAYGASSLISTRSTAQTQMLVIEQAGSSTGIYQFATLALANPAIAQPTLYTTSVALQDGAAYITPDVEIYNGNHSTATAYDGLTILALAGTLTGTYTVYGYAKL